MQLMSLTIDSAHLTMVYQKHGRLSCLPSINRIGGSYSTPRKKTCVIARDSMEIGSNGVALTGILSARRKRTDWGLPKRAWYFL